MGHPVCDVIKRNESDVANIDFEYHGYRLKGLTNSNVSHCLEIQRCAHISETIFGVVMGFGSKCMILNGQMDYIENSKLNIADM